MEKESSQSLIQLLNDGLTHHQTGELALAEGCYREVLVHDASHPDALNLLGVLARGRGELALSEELIRRAIERSPDVATYHHSLGRSYALREETQAAAASFRRAIALNPTDVDSMQVLGTLLATGGEPAEAIAWYTRALALSPDRPELQIVLTELLKSNGDKAGALERARLAAAQLPQHFDLQYLLASMLIEAGLSEEALAPLDRAIRLKPEEHLPYHCLGTLLHELGRSDQARAAYVQALRIKPDFVDSLSNLGALFKESGELRSGELLLRKAIELDPTFLNAHCNLGCLLEKQGDSLAALECFRAVLTLDQNHVAALCNLGLTLDNLGDEEGAKTCYRLAIQQQPEHPLCRFNLSLHHLADADFEAGWQEYEHRWRTPPFLGKRTAFTQKQWSGESLRGSTIFVYAEQGLGDTIQFYRYLPMLVELGAKVIFEVQAELFELLRDLHPAIQVIRKGEAVPQGWQWHCPLLSLPLAFGTDLHTIPGQTPYLSARTNQHAGRVAGLQDVSPERSGLKVGLVWSGNPGHCRDLARSLPLASLNGLLMLPGATYYSLQKGSSAKQLEQIPEASRPIDLGLFLNDFTDTAELIESLDLVLAVDTSVAHLAGALGKPVWIMLPCVSDWRWLKGRSDNPWYASARLFRQNSPGDWNGVIRQVEEELRLLVQGCGFEFVPTFSGDERATSEVIA